MVAQVAAAVVVCVVPAVSVGIFVPAGSERILLQAEEGGLLGSGWTGRLIHPIGLLLCLWLLPRFRICLSDAFPQAFKRLSPSIRAELFVGAQAGRNSLNYFFGHSIRAGFPLPIIKHFSESTDNRGVFVFVFMFQAKKFT